jgi:hypothetical protein
MDILSYLMHFTILSESKSNHAIFLDFCSKGCIEIYTTKLRVSLFSQLHPKAHSKSVPLPRQLNFHFAHGWFAVSKISLSRLCKPR